MMDWDKIWAFNKKVIMCFIGASFLYNFYVLIFSIVNFMLSACLYLMQLSLVIVHIGLSLIL